MKYERNYEQYLDCEQEQLQDASTTLKTLIKDYYLSKKTISNNPYGFIDDVISNNYMNNIEYYLDELNEIDPKKLNTDEQIWLESFKFNLNLEYQNYELETRFLGGNPSDMDKCFPLSYYNLWVVDNLNDAIDVFVRDQANNIVFKNDKPLIDDTKINNFEFKLNAYIQYLISLQNNLTQGMLYNVIPSRLVARLTARNLMLNMYSKELSYFAINQKLTKSIPSEFVTNYALKYVDLINDDRYTNLVVQVQSHLNAFMEFYLDNYVPYCLTSEYSYGGSDDNLFIFDDKLRVEIEQTYVYKNEQNHLFYIYGLGLTEKDLSTPNIGLGGMRSHQIDGNVIYQHYLDICSTTEYSPKQIFDIGCQLTTSTYEQMEIIGKEICELLKNQETNTWTPTIVYDVDGIGPEKPKSITCNIWNNHVFNFNEFNKWLNQENAFYGREIDFWTNKKIDDVLNNPKYQVYYQQLIDAGYQGWLKQINVDNKANAISGLQAFAGALTSLDNANDYKQRTTSYLHSYFYPINQDYAILPYNIKVQEIWGAGQEGLNMFGYNINPYYSEHKWAFPSFIIHEAVPGHHTQLAYWTKYFKGEKDENNKPIPYFSSTAFHEGWAVFMEWFGAQMNIYGLNIIDNKVVYENETPSLLFDEQNIETVQNGLFMELVKQSSNPNILNSSLEQQKQIAIKLAKLLTFYGYLNASQLRNIRLVVDTALHAEFDTQRDDIQSLCSLKDIRNFMSKYSAIGIGDQINESKRYLAWPAQATSYMLGKIVIQNFYNSILNQYYHKNGKQFVDYKKPTNSNTGPLFDLLLRNGEIPLKVLDLIAQIYKF